MLVDTHKLLYNISTCSSSLDSKATLVILVVVYFVSSIKQYRNCMENAETKSRRSGGNGDIFRNKSGCW